jgi:broad specificity phosphatase PhoE
MTPSSGHRELWLVRHGQTPASRDRMPALAATAAGKEE